MCDKSLFAYATTATTATATATWIAIVVLVLCATLPASVSASGANLDVSPSDTTGTLATFESLDISAEVELFKNAALTKIDYFLQYALPPKFRTEGEAIRADTVKQFERCAQLATSKEDIWSFKQCGGEELGKAMTALALLKEQAYSGAGSAMTHTFWWKLLKLVPFL